MTKIKNFFEFSHEINIIKESLSPEFESLIHSFKGKRIDIFEILKLNPRKYNKLSLEDIYENGEFNERLNKLNLVKDEIREISKINSFMYKNNFSFFTIRKEEKNELDNPDFILFEISGNILSFKVSGSISDFYDKLSTMKIKFTVDGEEMVYSTDDGGNTWYNIENDDNIVDVDDMLEIITKHKTEFI